jgi:glutamyl-Q tRNA(Asp) synthetase
LRIDDLDTPRNMKNGADLILAALENFGLQWDETVYYQSRHLDDYAHYLSCLKHEDRLYRCICSRKTLVSYGDYYPGFCRSLSIPSDETYSWRVITEPEACAWHDGIQGYHSEPGNAHGDFIIKRKDGIIAYQFAVVVDDYVQHITHIVRGYDLLAATARQIYLNRQLNFPIPSYSHVPIIVDVDGYKLSKQTLAAPVDQCHPQATVLALLKLLKQKPPSELSEASLSETLAWAIAHWQPDYLKNVHSVSETLLELTIGSA